MTPGYISRLLRLPLLAPDIVTAIVSGKTPPQLTAKKLMRLALELPIDWTQQRKLLGFSSPISGANLQRLPLSRSDTGDHTRTEC